MLSFEAPNLIIFIGFGDIHGPKPNNVLGFGDMNGPKTDKFIGFGDIHGPKPDVGRFVKAFVAVF
jgi:hypothetical protein